MSLRVSLAAAAALIGLGVLATPALAIQTLQVPDPQAPANANSTAPDALFDNSIPDTWQKKDDSSNGSSNSLSGFHFSVRGSNDTYQQPSTTAGYRDPLVPGSEFYQPLPGYTDPYLAPR